MTDTPVEDVRLERTFVDELRIDSLAMVEILEGSARHFGVRIDDEDAKYFVRVTRPGRLHREERRSARA